MDQTAYLNRINYEGPLAPTVETLHALQRAHLLAVPFENLSIHWQQPIVLTDEALFAKVVGQRRGGFCYELNGLFAALLRDLGFQVDMLSARVANKDGEYSRPFDHMTLLVHLVQPWLVDVGFGDTFRDPLRLDSAAPQPQHGRIYQLTADADEYIMLEQKDGGTLKPQFRFSLRPYQFADYEPMCRYHQTSPDSHFTQRRICSLATANGRVTLSEMQLIISTLDGERREQTVPDAASYRQLLLHHFGILAPQ